MKALLVVIDAASPRVVCPAIQTGRLPTLQRLALAGAMHDASVTIFPSITPAATTSIITGAYPNEHGIIGASWFDETRNEVAYYGDDFWVVARKGFGAFVRDFLLRLNGDRLKSPTMFELVEGVGRKAASVNYLVFRGRDRHKVTVPWTLAAFPGVPFTETVHGPTMLCLGDFVSPSVPTRGRKLKGKHGLRHRFGMDDRSSGAFLCDLMAARATPDLTVAYFADNDYRSHEVGPHNALGTVERVDAMLGDAFEAGGGLDRVLQDTFVLVTSDHGHCEVLADRQRAGVPLNKVLEEFRQATLGGRWRDRDEIMICPNMRAAQIYVREPTPVRVHRLIDALACEPRIDQIIWRSGLTRGEPDGCAVASPRGKLQFRRVSENGHTLRDAFGGHWDCRGNLEALGLELDGRDAESRDYPNPLERIAGALFGRQAGEVWVTAVPGCEFEAPGDSFHPGGGSHGALHALDSLSPVIAAGPVGPPVLPRAMRSLDVAPLCMRALDVPIRYQPGAPRT
ncbi:MAG TPA: alkaline phosphatase family protein [Vicinamibacterales bacterium]|nr:alkaline phosphatase family protein [Vicinamibacterales bacterium]